MTYWTLESNGVEKALADWGIDDLRASFTNQDEDVVELSLRGRPFDAAWLFPFKSTVVIRREREQALDGTFSGGTQYFVGLVTRPHASASGRTEAQGCALVGPWWYLNERGFEQEYKVFSGFVGGDPNADPIYTYTTTNRVFLNQAPFLPEGGGGGKLTTGEQLTEILNWTLKPFVDLSETPPFQIGEITLAVDPPIDEVKNITCGEAARKMFRWSPDAVAWFDYSTSPPTFHAKRRADLAEMTLDLSTTPPTAVSVNPRPDLARPFVKIVYEITSELNGQTWFDWVEDVWPNPPPADALSQFAGVPFTVDLRGFSASQVSCALTTETIAADSREWWLKVLPEYQAGLNDGTFNNFELVTGSVVIEPSTEGETLLGLPKRLVAGTPGEWVDAQFQQVKATAKARIRTGNGGDVPDEVLRINFTATDATSGTFTTGSTTQGDPLPVNLARDFYTAISEPFFEGRIEFQRAEVGGLAGLGNLLNLTGTAQADWSTMRALVQRVSESILHGVTSIEFGPPGHLNLGDLVSLFWVTRSRQFTQNIGLRSGAAGTNGGVASFRAHTATQNAAGSKGNPTRVVASGSARPDRETTDSKKGVIAHDGLLKKSYWTGAPADGSVTIQLGNGSGTAMGQNIALRETRGCDPSTGEPRYCMVLRSPWYNSPLTGVADQ